MGILIGMNALVTSLRDSFREAVSTPLYWVMAGLTALYTAVIWLILLLIGRSDEIAFSGYTEIIGITSWLFLGGFALFRIVYIMAVRRPAALLTAIRDDLASCLSPRRLMQALPAICVFMVFFPVFTAFKSLILPLAPFAWDPVFSNLDAHLSGGRQPWEMLQPLFGFAAVTFTINFVYNLWFFVKFLMFYWQGFARSHPEIRAQFFLTCLISWIVNGSVLAMIFSSAGPCYFGRVFPAIVNPYAGLMDYLHRSNEILPVWALNAQEYLWKAHVEDYASVLAGISAFPSMHVSIAFIFLLTARHYGRAATALFLVFFLFILFGSVHLGWHYAVDGYFAILSTGAIWLGCGALVRRFGLHHPRYQGVILRD